MRNYKTKFLLFIFISLSVTAKGDVVKVYDKGLDGNMRNYSIGCPNGKKTFISQKFGSDKSSSQPSKLQITQLETDVDEFAELEINSSSSSDEAPAEGTTSSIKQTAANIKRKLLQLTGQKNIMVCLYPLGDEMACKKYEDVDAAAKAACDLVR